MENGSTVHAFEMFVFENRFQTINYPWNTTIDLGIVTFPETINSVRTSGSNEVTHKEP